MNKQADKDQRKIYNFGKAFHELKDNPYFEDYQNMIQTIIDSLQGSICNDEPDNSHELDFKTILVHRAGKVKGLKDLQILQREYHNFFLKQSEQQTQQEDNDEADINVSKLGRKSRRR